jgi:hypothetical protein
MFDPVRQHLDSVRRNRELADQARRQREAAWQYQERQRRHREQEEQARRLREQQDRFRRSREQARRDQERHPTAPGYDYYPERTRRPGVSAFRRLIRIVVCFVLIAVLGGVANSVVDHSVSTLAGFAAAIVALVLAYNFIRMVFRILANLLG